MARPLRIAYEGALYHITSRGNERKAIFKDESDYLKFLDFLAELPKRYGVVIHGYVLMGNHYHLLAETPKGNITKAIHYLNAAYTGYFNRKYERAGHLFQGRYKGLVIEKERYLLSVSRYIHLNPVKARMVERPGGYQWSSYPEYTGKRKKSAWLTTEWVHGQFSKDESKARRLYRAFVDEGLTVKDNPFEDLKGGLILGSERFIDEIKKKVRLKAHREIPESRRLLKSISEEEVVAAVSDSFGTSEREMREPRHRGNEARKVCFYLLRRLTERSNEEIAGSFGIGYTAVSQAASRVRRDMEKNRAFKRKVEAIEGKLLSEE
jgi:REP element-mobilizing transposase RayT